VFWRFRKSMCFGVGLRFVDCWVILESRVMTVIDMGQSLVLQFLT
jgi:hypothetical protein